jgi:hypothetical protein
MATTLSLQLHTTQPEQPLQQMVLLGHYVHYQQMLVGTQQPMATTHLLHLQELQAQQPLQQMVLLGHCVHYQQVLLGTQQPLEFPHYHLDIYKHYNKRRNK